MLTRRHLIGGAAAIGLAFLSGGFWHGTPASCSQATTFLAAVTAQDTQHTISYKTLICGLVSDGVWAKLDDLWVERAAESATGLTSLVNPTHLLTNTNASFVANYGFVGNGTSAFLDSGFNPTTAISPNYTTASASAFAWSLESGDDPNGDGLLGQDTGSQGRLDIYPGLTSFSGRLNSTSEASGTYTVGNAAGLWLMSRLTSAGWYIYQNGNLLLSPMSGNNSETNANIVFLKTKSDFFTGGIAASGFGAGLTSQDISNLYARLSTYMQAIVPTITSATSHTQVGSGSTAPTITANTTANGSIPNNTNVSLAQAESAVVVRIEANWQQIEGSGGGSYTWTALDPVVAAFNAAGIQCIIGIEYGNTNYMATSFTFPTTSPEITAYTNFAVAVAHRYKPGGAGNATGVANIYEVWNEPNLNYATAGSPDGNAYATLLISAAAGIKGESGTAKVITGGLSAGAGIAPNTFIATVAGVSNVFNNVDGIGFHPYTTLPPETAVASTAAFYSAANSAKPIWWDEWGYPTDYVNNSQTTKGIYAARVLLSAAISGVPIAAWYNLVDNGANQSVESNTYGLNSSAYSPHPAATAYAAIASAMAGCTAYTVQYYTNFTAYLASFTNASGRNAVIWAADLPFQYTYNTTGYSSFTVKDVFGNSVTYTTSGSNITFPVGAPPVIVSLKT